MQASRIVIVGAGITGLTAAYWIDRETDARVTLVDPNGPGGKLVTERFGDFVFDLGPDSIFARKTAAIDLIEHLWIEGELVEPQAKEFSVFTHGHLHLVPRGLTSLGSISAEAVSQAGFLSEETKQRVTHPIDTGSVLEDTSVAKFFRAKYGDEFSRIVAEPVLAGTHAGDASKLSIAALYPGFLHEGLTGANSNNPAFVSFKTGIARLPDVLFDRLRRVDFHWSGAVNIQRGENGMMVRTTSGLVHADHVLLALPSNGAAPILSEIAPDVASEMAAIRHASSAVVTLVYDRSTLSEIPQGTGFLVPSGEDCPITGATWTSNKWPNRSPEDSFVVRVFLGRDGEQDVCSYSDDEILRRARGGLRQATRIDVDSVMQRVTKCESALPQYEVGHVERVKRIREGLKGLPITVAGTSYDGVSIPDCVRQGREAASYIIDMVVV